MRADRVATKTEVAISVVKGAMQELESPDQYLTLARASELSGIAATSLSNQASLGRLQTVALRQARVTTRVWLHEYLMARSKRQGPRNPLPDGYVPPEPAPEVIR